MFPASLRSRVLDLCLLGVVLPALGCAGGVPPMAPASLTVPESIPAPMADAKPDPWTHRVARAQSRVARTRVDSAALEREVTKRLAHRPLAVALTRRLRNPELADRVAAAVVYEAGRLRMSPSLLAGVLLIENGPADSSAISTQGAIGMMQVMPVHIGSYGCLSGDLLNVEANICHGARVLNTYLRRTKSVELALRRYNGCVRGRNTPRCYRYPIRVMRTASSVRREMLVNAAKLSETADEERDVSSSRLGASLPRSIETPDSAAQDSSRAAACVTFLGCIRNSWSR
jgi:soluble lytic murein transglycosylase-like protein